MKCNVCGGESGKYYLCYKCNKLKDEGKIVKCPDCGEWHYVEKSCKCEQAKKNNKIVKEIVDKKDSCKQDKNASDIWRKQIANFHKSSISFKRSYTFECFESKYRLVYGRCYNW